MIVRMNKIFLLGMEDQREALLSSLMELGAVEISQVDEEEYDELAFRPEIQGEVTNIENNIAKIRNALDSLNKYSPEKPGLFPERREVTLSEFNQILNYSENVWNSVNIINSMEERLLQLKNEENRLNNLRLSLLPWKNYPLPLEFSGTQRTAFLTGTIPSSIDLHHFKNEMQDMEVCMEIDVLDKDKDQFYVSIVYHTGTEHECLSAVKAIGFNRVSFSGLTGTVEENIQKIDKSIKELSIEKEKAISQIKDQLKDRRAIEALYDAFEVELSRTVARGKILETKKAFMIKGWIPAKIADKAKEKLESQYTVSIDITEPGEDEEFPVLLENRGIAEAGEPVSKMYSLPSSREIDPNAVMTPFFIMFFGLMLSDGGYGIIMAVLAGIALWRFKLPDSTRKFMKLILYCGIATIFWGIMFGSWFGIEALAKYGLWLNPVEEPELLLSWSLLFGVIHMYAGFGMKAANLIREKKFLDAVFDVGFVYIFYTGFILVLLPYAPKIDKEAVVPLTKIGQYMLIGGALLMLLTQGRDKKNIFGKFFGGLSSLYNVVGFMSDVLSYSRLLALGLATGIIASIINQMSVMFNFPLIIKIIIAVFILLIGHVINFAINALGAYVHSCRLQYLEFFGKFFTGGGEAFKPLKANTKYTVMRQNASD